MVFSYFFHTPFSTNDIPDLTGRVAIVTGGNSGIGYETTKALALAGCKVYIAARGEERARKAIDSIFEITGRKTVKYLMLDLSDLLSVKEAAYKFTTLESRLDILINNAASLLYPDPKETKDGFESCWGVNVLGHHLFIHELAPLLIKTAKLKAKADSVRIVTVSSDAHKYAPPGGVNLENQFVTGYADLRAYGQSKFGNLIIADYWHDKLAEYNIVSTTLHPGVIKTSDPSPEIPWLLRFVLPFLQHDAARGALTSLYAATSPELTVQNTKDAYFVPWGRRSTPSRKEYFDPEVKKSIMSLINKQLAPFL